MGFLYGIWIKIFGVWGSLTGHDTQDLRWRVEFWF